MGGGLRGREVRPTCTMALEMISVLETMQTCHKMPICAVRGSGRYGEHSLRIRIIISPSTWDKILVL